MEMYKKALMLNLTFFSTRGEVSLQDLFTIPLTGNNGASLNDIGTALKQTIAKQEESLIPDLPPVSDIIKFKLSIIEDVIKTRQENIEKVKTNDDRQKRKAVLTKALELKRADELSSMSEDEILEELKDMIDDE